jgi:hypothetical protein
MKKVYQTIIDSEKGNCMQAAIASLLDLELNDVPNFIEFVEDGNWHTTMYGFLHDKGYRMCSIYKERKSTDFLIKVTHFDGGVDGYFYASVPSQTFDGVSHAVIVDKDLNIVHDPNPNQLAMNLTPNDVESVLAMHEMVIGKTGKLFTTEEWENASPEEREQNTHTAN